MKKAANRIFLVAMVLNCCNLAIATEYTFTRVFTGPALPGVAINDNGLVALIYGNPNQVPNSCTLITTDGVASNIIAAPEAPYTLGYDNYQVLSLNKHGYVAFRGYDATGVYISNGTTTYKIAADKNNGGDFDLIYRAAISINDSGVVAFSARQSPAYFSGIFLGDGLSTPVRLAQCNYNMGSPTINNSGAVAYTANNSPTVMEIWNDSQIYSFSGTPIGSCLPDMNNQGVMVFADYNSGNQRIVVGDGIHPTTYIDGSMYDTLTDGLSPYGFGGNASIAINDQGLVAFGAATSMNPLVRGIFTGPDPVADKVIMEGDLLDGYTFDTMSFCHNGLNNKGQIAFTAKLSNGIEGVWIATPVPEPSALVLLSTVSCIFFAWGWRKAVN